MENVTEFSFLLCESLSQVDSWGMIPLCSLSVPAEHLNRGKAFGAATLVILVDVS